MTTSAFDLSERVVVVTGGYGVLGGTIAAGLAAAGARVAVLGRRQGAAEAKAEEIRAAGGRAMALVADALDERQLRDARGELLRAWGRVDALVNAAGGNVPRARNDARPVFEVPAGPQDYRRTHADGANMLAEAVAPHGGIVMWRAFVYSAETPTDRVRQAYDEFHPLDGGFRGNVLVQVKNGPLDFQPREPFHPLFGAMPRTPLMLELQVTQEYLGHGSDLVYLAPLFEEVLDADTHRRGLGSTVAKVIDGTLEGHRLTAIAGVANTGTDRSWTGHPFGQANWYAFGRLAWNPDLSSESIAGEWLRATFTHDPSFVAPVKAMMLRSRETAVSYMTPLGLHHIMARNHHYGPGPWVEGGGRADWTSVYYHRADTLGLGFDRTARGSGAVEQYAAPVRDRWGRRATVPDSLLLWFHRVGWTERMRSGRTLWDELVHTYDAGVDSVRAMRRTWEGVRGKVDGERHRDVAARLTTQERVARWWRDAVLLYFQQFSRQPFPPGGRAARAPAGALPAPGGAGGPRLPRSPAVTETARARSPRAFVSRLAASQEAGLVLVVALVALTLTLFAGSHLDRASGEMVNDFWNSYTLVQTATDASFFAIMAVGATVVIISGGIDLSVGSIYALAGVTMALVLRSAGPMDPTATVLLGLVVCTGVGLLCGLLNGALVVGLRVHPFIITLGTMWMLRGVAFVASRAESILVPQPLTGFAKAPLGLGSGGLYPVPMLAMILTAVVGTIYLKRTVMGRHVFAFGGNLEASRFAGLPLNRIQLGVFAVSGLTAGIAAFLGASFYGSASSGDAQGYELYVIASAVVGGASLIGGKGSALGATLGALLIVLFRQSIRTLRLDQNYEWIVIGAAIIVAVVVDQWSARMTARRLSRKADPAVRAAA